MSGRFAEITQGISPPPNMGLGRFAQISQMAPLPPAAVEPPPSIKSYPYHLPDPTAEDLLALGESNVEALPHAMLSPPKDAYLSGELPPPVLSDPTPEALIALGERNLEALPFLGEQPPPADAYRTGELAPPVPSAHPSLAGAMLPESHVPLSPPTTAFGAGMERAGMAADTAQLYAGTLTPEEFVGRMGQRAQAIHEYRGTVDEETQAQLENIQAQEGFWDTLAALATNPRGTGNLAAETIPLMAPALIAGPTLALAGFFIGGPVGATVGGATGSAGGSFMTEYFVALTTVMEERGVDLMDRDAVMAALQDPELYEAAKTKGAYRGSAIAAVDLLSWGLAGRLFGAGNRVTQRLAQKVSSNPAIQSVARGTGQTALVGAEVVQQATLEGAGEALAQVVDPTQAEIRPSEIALEAGLGGLLDAPVTLGTVAASKITAGRRAEQAESELVDTMLGMEAEEAARTAGLGHRMEDAPVNMLATDEEIGPRGFPVEGLDYDAMLQPFGEIPDLPPQEAEAPAPLAPPQPVPEPEMDYARLTQLLDEIPAPPAQEAAPAPLATPSPVPEPELDYRRLTELLGELPEPTAPAAPEVTPELEVAPPAPEAVPESEPEVVPEPEAPAAPTEIESRFQLKYPPGTQVNYVLERTGEPRVGVVEDSKGSLPDGSPGVQYKVGGSWFREDQLSLAEGEVAPEPEDGPLGGEGLPDQGD